MTSQWCKSKCAITICIPRPLRASSRCFHSDIPLTSSATCHFLCMRSHGNWLLFLLSGNVCSSLYVRMAWVMQPHGVGEVSWLIFPVKHLSGVEIEFYITCDMSHNHRGRKMNEDKIQKHRLIYSGPCGIGLSQANWQKIPFVKLHIIWLDLLGHSCEDPGWEFE